LMGHALSLRARRSAFLSDRDPSGRPAVLVSLAGGGGLTVEEPQELQDEEYERVYERVAAIDVAKASGVVCTRVPDESRPGRRRTRVWTVTATMSAVTELADHLRCHQIEVVTLESTSDYWRIWWVVLEAAGVTVQLVNARAVKNVPGRAKTDLLTELRAGLGQVSGQAGISGANVCRHDHWRRSTAGVVRSGGAAVRFACDDRGSV
jgi:Transposase